jgi:hypothetical protein
MYLISSSSKNVLSEALPSFTRFFISSSTCNQPTSPFNLIKHRHLTCMNPPMQPHACIRLLLITYINYLFRYTLGIIFVIPVLRAYFVNLLNTQHLHHHSADKHTVSLTCMSGCGGGRLTGHRSLMISSYEILNFLKMTCQPTHKLHFTYQC